MMAVPRASYYDYDVVDVVPNLPRAEPIAMPLMPSCLSPHQLGRVALTKAPLRQSVTAALAAQPDLYPEAGAEDDDGNPYDANEYGAVADAEAVLAGVQTVRGSDIIAILTTGMIADYDIDTGSDRATAALAFQSFVSHTPRVAPDGELPGMIIRDGFAKEPAPVKPMDINNSVAALLINKNACLTGFISNVAQKMTPLCAAAVGDGDAGPLHGLIVGAADDDDNPAPRIIGFPVANIAPRAMPPNTIRTVLAVLADAAELPMMEDIHATNVANVIIALSKKGELSQEKARKLKRELDQKTDKQLELTSRTVAATYDCLSPLVTQHNIGNMLEMVRQGLLGQPELMRLSLVAQQASLAGLTSIVVINQAIMSHPKFPWAELHEMWPTQMVAVQGALLTIRNDVFYGYRENLEEHKATRYRDVSYVAKELLIKLDGMSSLAEYAGWKTRPRNKERLDNMIAAYVDHMDAPPTANVAEASMQFAALLIANAKNTPALSMDLE